ncbi:hypothetical protein PHMEG_0005964 [Phytophthora megakarya]|uniref:Uncharacterized protein n=1 Tax=Phytophthora megakarya TaxID=4795 RepID=A0A225WRS6_9STRA|nr:hypothetical protein PHMEG_0005964 [Phytophthora megakarya]
MMAFVVRVHEFFRENEDTNWVYADFTFVYLYPVDIDAYQVRVSTEERFKEDKEKNWQFGHRLAIWPHITEDIKVAVEDSP